MIYNIYTDGSVNKEKGVLGLSYVIVTDDKFVAMNQYQTYGTLSTKAELIAIGMAAEYLLKNTQLQLEDEVVFTVDSYEAIHFFTTATGNQIFGSDKDPRIDLVSNMYSRLSEKVSVRFKKAWAHKGEAIFANKLADKLAKYALVL